MQNTILTSYTDMHPIDCLKIGDKIKIVSPSGKTSPESLQKGIELLKSWGLTVEEGKHLFGSHHQFAGTDEQRLSDLQNALDDPLIKAIIFSRGGYGMTRIIDRIKFEEFQKHPKWIVGFSDITALHGLMNNKLGFSTIHGPMVKTLTKDLSGKSAIYLKRILFERKLEYTIRNNPLNRLGKAEGILIGGNLSIVYNCLQSNSDFNPKGKILFLEDLNEHLYHIDRMIVGLKRAGKLCGLSGIIAGNFSSMKDNQVKFGKTASEIIREHVSEYDYPVCFGFPAGHTGINYPIILGKNAILDVLEKKVRLIQE